MGDIICFDTQIVIWAVKKEATPGQEDMILKAEILLNMCNENKSEIIIPSIVIAELLSGLPPDRHSFFIKVIEKNFSIPPFDLHAAAVYAKIWRNSKELRKEEKERGAKREEMKADSMIVAIAKARGAICIYSEDPRLRKFAEGYIEAKSLSDVKINPVQGELEFKK